MLILLAAFPILLLLILMTAFRWSGARAGLVSWSAALAIAAAFFGLTSKVFVVSQLKGLLFSIYVLAALWPALLLYHLNNGIGGIKALTSWLSEHVADPVVLKIILAWTFTGILEGIAGFGLPIAVAAPMLVSLGVPALLAVTAAAIGNSWAVTFGNMGMVFQSLVTISGYSETQIIPFAAVLMGIACLLCGLAVAHVLGEIRHWRFFFILAVIMSLVQYLIAAIGLVPLSGFGASLVGLISGILISRKKSLPNQSGTNKQALIGTLSSYSILSLITLTIFIGGPIHDLLYPILWKMEFPE
ncbi:L-lactate permease, partial [bacterium]|nr:L-lactate permease [bacterium]